MQGETTTVRADPVNTELHRIIQRNATAEDEDRARVMYANATFQASGRRYQIVNAYRDDLKRLILFGTLENK